MKPGGTSLTANVRTNAVKAQLTCIACGARQALVECYRCPRCAGELAIEYDHDRLRASGAFAARWRGPGSMWDRFADLLPQENADAIVTLGEGATPLAPAPRLARHLGVREIWLKLESANPTGSYKDRQVGIGLSKAREWGRGRFATISSGNVGISLSAYCAAAGVEAHVWVSGETAAAKQRQVQIYGARLFVLPDPRDGGDAVAAFHGAFVRLPQQAASHDLVPMITARPANPYMVEGAKTIAYEIAAAIGAPTRVFAPVGGGGCVGGLANGFADLHALGLIDRVPPIDGTQRGEYHAPIDRLDQEPYRSGQYYRPLDGAWAWRSIRATGGALRLVESAAIEAAQGLLARLAGVFAEPQGAYGVAGLLLAKEQGALKPDERIVVVITGMGLKDMEAGERIVAAGGYAPPVKVASLEDGLARLGLPRAAQ
jgi:threonine synthase